MSIYYPVIFVSALFYAIGYFINKENSKYLLSGYNTMSEEERKKFDLDAYLKLFKPFFKQQALISLIVFQIVYFLYNDNVSLIIWCIYISTAPLFLVLKSNRFKRK
jgi:hypothetical protein